MALKNRETNKKYLRLKDGKFYINKEETPYEELEGLITNMRYKDEEFEGTPIRKLAIIISDDEDNYELGINVENSYYSTLISFLKNVDITQPLTLHPKTETINRDGKEITKRSILVSQNGKFAKGYFTKDGNQTPAWNVVKVGSKKVTDKTEYLEFLEDFVKENFIDVINSSESKPTYSRKVSNDKMVESILADDNVSDDDLPF